VTTSVYRSRWRPDDDYDDHARWADDADGGDRWRAYAACVDADPALFFPVVVERRVVPDRVIRGELVPSHVIEVATDEEPAYPPPAVQAICARCPVSGRCLDRYMDEEFGIFGGTTGYQRQLLTKKTLRKRCLSCGATELVTGSTHKKEVCLACGLSWDIV
jgi:hypothetical protein